MPHPYDVLLPQFVAATSPRRLPLISTAPFQHHLACATMGVMSDKRRVASDMQYTHCQLPTANRQPPTAN
ncbi:MAG: hypothetical protein MUD01_23360 [Chloroflexaceae bacterium]|nr:hypothetical protein [Chloroflexaceae bacterium]